MCPIQLISVADNELISVAVVQIIKYTATHYYYCIERNKYYLYYVIVLHCLAMACIAQLHCMEVY